MNKKQKNLKKIKREELQSIFDQLIMSNEQRDFFRTYQVSELFIENNIDKITHASWLEISDYQILSETFMSKHTDKLGWVWISQSQTLSETFMEKYSDFLHWDWASLKQKMSLSFLLKNIDKINLERIKSNNQIDHEELVDFQFEVFARLAQQRCALND